MIHQSVERPQLRLGGKPVAGQDSSESWGSDAIASMLRTLDIPYVALNPGSSFRGIHDSLVNYSGGKPEMVLCCHEEIAVSLAHGYAKAVGKPMAAIVHDVVSRSATFVVW